jgi:diadenosine tetraphosphate (Ap4A) HIT family hydrolase
MNENCKDCQELSSFKHQILKTDNWVVRLPKNQAWLGRVCVHLRHHKESLDQLSDVEWQELKQIINTLSPAYLKAFNAYPINWVCNMNNAFRQTPAYPHVHWHAFPRYKEAQEINNIVFEDKLYGEHYDPNDKRIVDDTTLEVIAEKLKRAIDEEQPQTMQNA